MFYVHKVTCKVTFDHDIVDGAPAARFTSRFKELLSRGGEVLDLVHGADSGPTDDVTD